MKFIFLGTADFGEPALQSLIDAGHELLAVVTNPPKPYGRGRKLRKSQINSYCLDNSINVPILTPDNLKDEEFQESLKKYNADVFIVVAFSILPESLFSIPSKGTFNIHAALLPKYRGPAPIHRAIEVGESETGVTLFRIDKGVDTGNILLQKSLKILENEDTPHLYERLSKLGGDIAKEGFSILESASENYKTQDNSKATKAPLLKKSESIIDWSLSAINICRKVRAFKPFPGTTTTINDKKAVVVEAFPSEISKDSAEIGEIIDITKDEIFVQSGEGSVIINMIKPAGKRAMTVRDFINGSTIEKGTVLV